MLTGTLMTSALCVSWRINQFSSWFLVSISPAEKGSKEWAFSAVGIYIIGKLACAVGPFKSSVRVGLCADHLLSWKSTYSPKGKSQRLSNPEISGSLPSLSQRSPYEGLSKRLKLRRYLWKFFRRNMKKWKTLYLYNSITLLQINH